MELIFEFMTYVCLFFLVRNIFRFFFAMENYNVHKKRLKQLQFKHKNENDTEALVESITAPIIKHVLSRMKPKNLEDIERDLRISKWDKNINAEQYRALNILLKVLGVGMFLLFMKAQIVIACLWGGVLCFGMGYLLNNSVKNRTSLLVSGFPQFVRITTGHLSADMTLQKAVSEAIKYVDDAWKPVLSNFVVNCELEDVNCALDKLAEEVEIFEVREFVSLAKLSLEQGGNIKESFYAQAQKVQEMLQDLIVLKVGKRQMMSMALQGPLLICNLLVFGLPTFGSMMNMSSM